MVRRGSTMAYIVRRCLITFVVIIFLSCWKAAAAPASSAEKRQMGMGMGMGMDMSMGMNMAMNMLPTTLSSTSLTSMSNPLTLQMPFAPNPFYNQMYPARRHQLSLDGNGQDFLDQPLNPYEKVLNSKYPTSPFERLFGKQGPLAAPAVSTVLSSYQTNQLGGGGGDSGGGFDEQGEGSSGYMGSYSGAYESGDFGIKFGRRSATTTTLAKSKLLRLSTVRSDVYYRNEAYADYFEL